MCIKQMVTDLQFLATGLHESKITKSTLIVNQDEVKAPDLAKQVSAMAKDHPPITRKFNRYTKQVYYRFIYKLYVLNYMYIYLRLSITGLTA